MEMDFSWVSTGTPAVRPETISAQIPSRSRPLRTRNPISADRGSSNFYLTGR